MLSLSAGVNRGGSITAANVAQDVAAHNGYRRGMTFQNTSDTDMWLTEANVDAAVGVGYKVGAGQAVNVSTNMRVSVLCTAQGKTFAATEY